MLKTFLKILKNYKVPHFIGGCLLVVVAVSGGVVPLHFSLFLTTYIEVNSSSLKNLSRTFFPNFAKCRIQGRS